MQRAVPQFHLPIIAHSSADWLQTRCGSLWQITYCHVRTPPIRNTTSIASQREIRGTCCWWYWKNRDMRGEALLCVSFLLKNNPRATALKKTVSRLEAGWSELSRTEWRKQPKCFGDMLTVTPTQETRLSQAWTQIVWLVVRPMYFPDPRSIVRLPYPLTGKSTIWEGLNRFWSAEAVCGRYKYLPTVVWTSEQLSPRKPQVPIHKYS